MEQRVVVLVFQVVKEMVKVDKIIPGMYGVDVSVATQSQVPTIRTVQKIVESLRCKVTEVTCSTKFVLQLQSLIEWWMCQLLMVCDLSIQTQRFKGAAHWQDRVCSWK